ncbi:hypothetical protein AX17_001861 [Amanita inopinata Kibby_2008]|nr:hypothetical protein AX17_001861 [Amanita inopinata Kibby_2008]
MAVNPDEDTEFNDALRKHGILPPREPSPRTPSPPPSPALEELLDDLTISQLQELEEDAKEDSTQRLIEHHKRQRLAEERDKLRKSRFGRLYPISRDDYTREVTEASKEDEDGDNGGRGTGVVCLLYKDGIQRSDRTFQHVKTLAIRHPRTKFVSIVGDKCIPNLPDARAPMIIIYRGGDIRNQIIAWGSDKERQIEELEAILISTGAVDTKSRIVDQDNSDDENEEEHHWSRTTSAASQKNMRGSSKRRDDEDSDFEFDL